VSARACLSAVSNCLAARAGVGVGLSAASNTAISIIICFRNHFGSRLVVLHARALPLYAYA